MKKFVALLIVSILVLSLAPAVLADPGESDPLDEENPTGTITINAGGLSIAPRSFTGELTLSGADSNISITDDFGDANIDWEVIDARGNGAGWHLNISATDFICLSGSCAKDADPENWINLPLLIDYDKHAGERLFQFTIDNSEIYWMDGSYGSCSQDCNGLAGNDRYNGSLMPDAINFTTLTPITHDYQKFMTASADTAMGTYRFSPDFNIDIPAETYQGVYRSTLTIQAISAP